MRDHLRSIILAASCLIISTSLYGDEIAPNASINGPQANTSEDSSEPSTILLPKSYSSLYGDLDEMKARKLIRVLITYSPTDFFFVNGYPRGIQADLIGQLDKELNRGIKKATERVRFKFIPVTFNQLIPALKEGKGDIAAALLTVTPERLGEVDFAHGKNVSVSEIVVRHRDTPQLKALADLAGKKVVVLRGSSYIEHLNLVNKRFEVDGLQPIKIQVADQYLLSEDILQMVNAGLYQYTVIDDFKGELWAKTLPNLILESSVKLSANNQLGWAIRQNSPQLKTYLSDFINKRAKKGTALGNQIIKRYFGTTRWISNPNTPNKHDRLTRLLPLFEHYGEKYQHDPLMLAAQAYQESGLRQDQISHMGAVGIMQLLPTTAADPNVAISNIDQLEGNIHAGSKYLAFLRQYYFSDPEIDYFNQELLSLAAYNAGPGNVKKMRRVATKLGLNPNIWFGNVELAASKVVGNETVNYVANIYKYYIAYKLAETLENNKKQIMRKGQPDGNATTEKTL